LNIYSIIGEKMSPKVNLTILESLANSFTPAVKTGLKILLVLMLLGGLFLPFQSTMASSIPTFSIAGVVVDDSVTITTYNYPAGVTFTVRMGEYGTLGVNGIVVGTFDSGAGGSFNATFDIPDALKGDKQIAIRTDGDTGGWYAYNWFWNNTSGSESTSPTSTPVPGATATPPVYSGIPTFSILSVEMNENVTIRCHNYPGGQVFTARMGPYGTAGINGIVVGQFDSGSGGDFDVSFDIPAELANHTKIAIRTDSAEGFFAYNWFWNNTTSGGESTSPTSTPVPGATTTPAPPAYSGIPTFSISSVVRDDSVTITTNNYPANETFTVRMGPYGTAAIGGTVVGTTDSGSGGSFSATYSIPDSLKGSTRIAIGMVSGNGYFAYNWFWNNTAN
jgi:hypothetical protein